MSEFVEARPDYDDVRRLECKIMGASPSHLSGAFRRCSPRQTSSPPSIQIKSMTIPISTKHRAHSTVHITGDIQKDIEDLVRDLENLAADKPAVSAAVLLKASEYLRLIFRPGAPLYRTPYLRIHNSSQSVAAESLVATALGAGNDGTSRHR